MPGSRPRRPAATRSSSGPTSTATFERLRAAILTLDPELDPKGWVEAVVAGNTYEHYEEHRDELRAETRTEA